MFGAIVTASLASARVSPVIPLLMLLLMLMLLLSILVKIRLRRQLPTRLCWRRAALFTRTIWRRRRLFAYIVDLVRQEAIPVVLVIAILIVSGGDGSSGRDIRGFLTPSTTFRVKRSRSCTSPVTSVVASFGAFWLVSVVVGEDVVTHNVIAVGLAVPSVDWMRLGSEAANPAHTCSQ